MQLGFLFSTLRFHFDPASGTLSLSVVHCDDSGWYSCVASDGSETVMKRAYLTVLCGTGEVAYNMGGGGDYVHILYILLVEKRCKEKLHII